MKKHFTRTLHHVSGYLRLWKDSMKEGHVIEMACNRSVITICCFLVGFLIVGIRLFDVMLFRPLFNQPSIIQQDESLTKSINRADILDRNGEVLATNLMTASIYANPKIIINSQEAVDALASVIPDLNKAALLQKLKVKKGFIWIKRHAPPSLQNAVHNLGIPGIYLQPDYKRVYPFGNLVSHVVGLTNIDSNGLSGIEKYFDSHLIKNNEPISLSIDIRLQHILRDELIQAIAHFEAIGANGMIIDVDSGEILAMVSLPDFDPNLPINGNADTTFNKNTLGVYEPGSTFKILNTAIGVESGYINLNHQFDASHPIKVGRFLVNDYRGKNRVLSTVEVFLYSSNIGSAKMALTFGGKIQRAFLETFGVFQTPRIEIPEVGAPLYPKTWNEPTVITASYGHGIAISPVQVLTAITGIINNGKYKDFTLRKLSDTEKNLRKSQEKIVLSAKTSATIRELMHLFVTEGNGKSANIPGLNVFGKTGTAIKLVGKGYSHNNRMAFFIGGFPKNKPKYMFYICLDDPKPVKGTYGFSAAGWNAAPTAQKIMYRVASILGFSIEESKNSTNNSKSYLIPVKGTIEVDEGQ